MLSRVVRPTASAGVAALRYACARRNSFSFNTFPMRKKDIVLICCYYYRPQVPNAANFATLREIEGRLKSIRNIEKITKTMKIVASTKLTRAQRAMTSSRSYGQSSNQVFEEAETKVLEGEGKTLLVVCSSDKGLCGGIHSGLSRFVRREFSPNPDTFELVVLGEKCKAQLSRSNPKNMTLSFGNVGKAIPTFADASAIADQITQLTGNYSSIKILYNKFVNAQQYEPTIIEAFSEDAIKGSGAFMFSSNHNSAM
jgi:F-type H+-transporting ATPase subunit gamma